MGCIESWSNHPFHRLSFSLFLFSYSVNDEDAESQKKKKKKKSTRRQRLAALCHEPKDLSPNETGRDAAKVNQRTDWAEIDQPREAARLPKRWRAASSTRKHQSPLSSMTKRLELLTRWPLLTHSFQLLFHPSILPSQYPFHPFFTFQTKPKSMAEYEWGALFFYTHPVRERKRLDGRKYSTSV